MLVDYLHTLIGLEILSRQHGKEERTFEYRVYANLSD